jgi:NitT/TauT family transport system permease protein
MKRSFRAIGAALVLGLCWWAAALAVGKPFLPAPGPALARFAGRIADGSLLVHLGASAGRIGLSLLLAGPPAVILGLAAGRSRRFDAFLSPFVYLLHPLPKVAFLPVIMLLFGLGEAAKDILIGLIVLGQVLVAARDAARSVEPGLVDAVLSLGATKAQVLGHVVFPACLPSLLTALRVGLGTAIAVLFLAETFATQSGLGWYVMDAWARVDYPDMYAAIIALSLFGFAVYAAIDLMEAWLCRWRKKD